MHPNFALPGLRPARPPDARRHWPRSPSGDQRGRCSTSRNRIRHGGGPIGVLGFPADPDTPATAAPPVAWLPLIDTRTLTIVRPVPWARTVGDLLYRPSAWGNHAVRLPSSNGTHVLVRRHGAPELALWLPAGLEPKPGQPFGLYLHPDSSHSDRIRAAELFRRAVGLGTPLSATPCAHAHRQAAMLCIHDRLAAGTSLRDIAAELLDPVPQDWRVSSERSDLRRLAGAASEMVGGGYRRLLGSRAAE